MKNTRLQNGDNTLEQSHAGSGSGPCEVLEVLLDDTIDSLLTCELLVGPSIPCGQTRECLWYLLTDDFWCCCTRSCLRHLDIDASPRTMQQTESDVLILNSPIIIWSLQALSAMIQSPALATRPCAYLILVCISHVADIQPQSSTCGVELSDLGQNAHATGETCLG